MLRKNMFKIIFIVNIIIKEFNCGCGCRCIEQPPNSLSDLSNVQGSCQPKSQRLLLLLLEKAGKVLKGRKGFRNAGKVLKMQERF